MSIISLCPSERIRFRLHNFDLQTKAKKKTINVNVTKRPKKKEEEEETVEKCVLVELVSRQAEFTQRWEPCQWWQQQLCLGYNESPTRCGQHKSSPTCHIAKCPLAHTMYR